MSSAQNIPIFILGNDAILPELVRLLASVRRFAPTADVRFVPFNDDCALCRRVADIYGCHLVDEDLSEIDAFGHEIFDDDPPQQPYPYMLGKLRKLIMFRHGGPAMYLDVDTILVSPLFDIVAQANETPFDLGFISPSKAWIYEDVEEARPLIERTKGFSSSFLMLKPGRFDFEMIKDTVRRNMALYRQVRRRGVIDQPLLNFVADMNNLDIVSLPDLLKTSAHTVATSDSISFKVRLTAKGEVIQMWQQRESQVLFLHAVGKYKHYDEYDYLFKSALYEGIVHVFRNDHDLGLKLLEIIDQWRPVGDVL
jgi:hypothetical protein